jgi:hypothetical protein
MIVLRTILALGLIITPHVEPAKAAETTLRCTNIYSGTTWDVQIDTERGTVDAFPAEITRRRIVWRDAVSGGHYDLDRASGLLKVVFASSTGGYTQFNRCHPADGG